MKERLLEELDSREMPQGKRMQFYHDPKAAPKKGTSAAAGSGEDKPKPKPTPKPKPKGKPSALVVGHLSFLEESDDEGIAASVKMNTVKEKKVSFNDDVDDIIFNKAVYSIRDIWKPVIRKPLRPDIKRYETREVTDQSHREQNRFDAKVAEARAILMVPYTSIKEVHIPLGPNGDIAITMRFDEEDGLVYDRKLIPHVCGKHGIRGEVQTLSVPAKGSRAKFIMDSGHD